MTGSIEIDKIQSFSAKEILAIKYAKLISQTPVDITAEFMEKVKSVFTEREIVILSSTAAIGAYTQLLSFLRGCVVRLEVNLYN